MCNIPFDFDNFPHFEIEKKSAELGSLIKKKDKIKKTKNFFSTDPQRQELQPQKFTKFMSSRPPHWQPKSQPVLQCLHFAPSAEPGTPSIDIPTSSWKSCCDIQSLTPHTWASAALSKSVCVWRRSTTNVPDSAQLVQLVQLCDRRQ